MSEGTQEKLAWATNFSAPYREPVWEELAQSYDIQMLFVGDRTTASGRVRDDSWFESGSASYRTMQARVLQAKLRGHEFPILGPGGSRFLGKSAALVIGGWETPAYWQLLASAKRRRVRTVGFYESTSQSQHFKSGIADAARRRFFTALDAVVTPGSAATNAVLEMGVQPGNIYTGFNAVDVARFHDHAAQNRLAPNGNLGHSYLYVGQLIGRKNVGALVSAFARSAASTDTLTIAGEGVERKRILDQVTALGLGEQISLVGAVSYDEMPAFMARHHTLVLPSAEEVWGLVANEALAAGLQCVVTDRCGVAESIHNMTGVFITRPDERALANAMNLSRVNWTGYISHPEILRHTPAAFAATFAAAIAGDSRR